jgi:hypothetical protein
MRILQICAVAIVAAAVLFARTPAQAAPEIAWCLQRGNDNHSIHCGFTTREQCERAILVGDQHCWRDPSASQAAASKPAPRRKR